MLMELAGKAHPRWICEHLRPACVPNFTSEAEES